MYDKVFFICCIRVMAYTRCYNRVQFFSIFCLFVQNFVAIGWTVAELLHVFDFQYGGRPPSWIFEICKFLPSTRFGVTIVFPDPDFLYDAGILAIWPQVRAKLHTFSLRMRETARFLLLIKNLTSSSCSPTLIFYKARKFWRYVNI